MSAEPQSQMSEIMKFSRLATSLCAMLVIMYAVSLLVWLLIIAFAPVSANWGIRVGSHLSIWSLSHTLWPKFDQSDGTLRHVIIDHIVGTRTKVWLSLVVLLFHAWLLKFFYHGFKLFGNYAKGDLFGNDNIHQIRQLGINTLLGFFAQWLAPLIIYFLRQSGDQPWLPTVEVGFGFQVMMPLYAGGIIILVARVMDVGRGIRDEKQELEAEQALVI